MKSLVKRVLPCLKVMIKSEIWYSPSLSLESRYLMPDSEICFRLEKVDNGFDVVLLPFVPVFTEKVCDWRVFTS